MDDNEQTPGGRATRSGMTRESLERQKSLLIKTKEAEIARIKLETLNIYASIFIKSLVLLLMLVLYLEWDTVDQLWLSIQE